MMNLLNDRTWRRLTPSLLILGAGLAILPACSKQEEAAPDQTTYTPPPAVEVDPLEDLDMDSRVQFPAARAPTTRALAEAIANLASAIVEGDADALDPLLDPVDRELLSDMAANGVWALGTKELDVVRVCVLEEEPDGAECRLGLGVQDETGAYMIAWTGLRAGEVWTFSGMAIEPLTAQLASMLDGLPLIAPTLPGPYIEPIVEKPADEGTPNEDSSTDTGGGDPGPGPAPGGFPRKPTF